MTQPTGPQWAYRPFVAANPGSSTATGSLLAGILGWVCFPLIGPVIAVSLGYVSRSESKRAGYPIAGNALAGIVLGSIQLALLGFGLIFWVLAAIVGAIQHAG